MKLIRKKFQTPVGSLIALASSGALVALEFEKPDRKRLLEAKLDRWFGRPAIHDGESPILKLVGEWLEAYFGDGESLPEIPLDLRGSRFELRVWRAMTAIPNGTTVTYGDLAREIGAPRAARAVGHSSLRNSICLIVPCHHVVGSNGSLTGYGGGLETKRRLLDREIKISSLPRSRSRATRPSCSLAPRTDRAEERS